MAPQDSTLTARFPHSTPDERYFATLCLLIMRDERTDDPRFDPERFMTRMGVRYGPTVERMIREEVKRYSDPAEALRSHV